MDTSIGLSTGLPGLDKILHGIQPGDNIVWQSDTPNDYLPFVDAFCCYAKTSKKKLVYFRFANHLQLVGENSDARICRLAPREGFESFITRIHKIIAETGPGAYYVFDSLSELAQDCFSERMMGNFFALTCPYLFALDTVSYFHLLRNYNSHHAAEPITETTQLLLDIYHHDGKKYVHPLKVQGRYSPTMHMLHVKDGDEFCPVEHSAITSKVLNSSKWYGLRSASYRMVGEWDKRFLHAEEKLGEHRRGECSNEEINEVFLHQLTQLISRDEKILTLARRYLTLEDLIYIWKHTIGSGFIGGKAIGMLLARAILRQEDSHWSDWLEEHDSFFVGSDIFYTFLVQNDCWGIHQKQKNPDTIFEDIEEARQRILRGHFPDYIIRRFSNMLEYYGQCPIIVRSSSLLEDNYGNAFVGKYESVFCVNTGSQAERLEAFLHAVRIIYAGTMSKEVLTYRAKRNMLDKDEQMALLVMRVSGAPYSGRYFPHFAGVGLSFNPYAWSREIDPHAGLLRLVFGLGTRAVNATDDDHTRIVALNAPEQRPEANFDEVCRYAQHRFDFLDLEAGGESSGDFSSICATTSELPLDLVSSIDRTIADRGREVHRVLTFDRLLRDTEFVSQMRDMLRILQEAYEHPVDIEFAANVMPDQTYRVNLLQCRTLQVQGGTASELPEISVKKENRLIKARGAVVGQSRFVDVARFVYVVPEKYSELSEQDRYAVARLIGDVNRIQGMDSALGLVMAIGPGRWGTSTPSLGIPVTGTDINHISVLCEVVGMHKHLIPDISLGTHFFNELVELNMLYVAIFPDQGDNYLNRSFFLNAPSCLPDLLSVPSRLQDVVRVIDVPTLTDLSGVQLLADAEKQEVNCFCKVSL